MSSGKFSAGRKEALQDIKSIIKSSQATIDKMDLSHFTGSKRALSTPEAATFLTDSSKKIFELIQKDLDCLEKGETTQKIRGVPPFSINEDTEGAGKISAYRDVYNMIQSITTEEALLPVPRNISRWHRNKAAKAQTDIVSTARAHILQSIATKGQSETIKYEKECAEARAREQLAAMSQNNGNWHNTANRPNFNNQAAPKPAPVRHDYANIDMDYIQSFEEKSLLHPYDMDEESLAYFNGLNEAITVIENYKSSIKNKYFPGISGPGIPVANALRRINETGSNSSSLQTGFCRTHSLAIIQVAREAIVAMMKGAEPHKICKKISVNSPEKGFAKALDDISCIVNEINPNKIGINHSHGYRLTASPQLITHMAYTVTEQTTNEMSSLMKVLANAGSAAQLLQTGIVETMTGGQRGQRGHRTQRAAPNNTFGPS